MITHLRIFAGTTDIRMEDQITIFVRAAVDKGDFHHNPKEDAQLYRMMKRAVTKLYASESGRSAFEQLLFHESVFVKQWVAAQLVTEDHLQALSVLKQIAANGGITGGNARIIISQHEHQQLRSPFGLDTITKE